MARMNVRKKMKSSHTFESYWDMLPPEIHTIIIAYKKGQEEIDEQRKKRMKDLCLEVVQYGELKRRWGIGHIKCIVGVGICRFCRCHHLEIKGCHEDEDGERMERFLGFDFKMALDQVDIVKSSL